MTQTPGISFRLLFAAGILTALSACQTKDSPSEDRNVSTTSSPNISGAEKVMKKEMNLNQQLEYSKQDLANRLGIQPGDIMIKVARKITWRSGALGCPKPGMSYTEALVPGVLIILEASGTPYGYHAQVNQKPFHCPTRRAVIPDTVQKEDLA